MPAPLSIIPTIESILNQVAPPTTQIGTNKANRNSSNEAGDVEIVRLVMFSEDQSKQYNLIPLVRRFDVFESITQPCIFAELQIEDTIGLFQSFPIVGEEVVSISFKTAGVDTKPTNYTLRVNRVADKQVSANKRGLTYTLQCCSAEMIRNANYFVTRTEKDTVANIIEKVIKEDLQTNKQLMIDSTRGIEQITIAKQRPLVAVDFLRHRAISPQYNSSSFVFFESRDGYTFTTIEAMMENGRKNITNGNTDKVFFYDKSIVTNVEQVTARNILAYNQIQFGDQIFKVARGGLSNSVDEYDLLTGSLRRIEYNKSSQDFVQSSDKSRPVNSGQFVNNYGKTNSTAKMRTISSDRPETELSEKISALTGYVGQLMHNTLHIYVYGDHQLQVGDMIKCIFPSGTDADRGGLSQVDSGNYLIAKLRHIIANTDRPFHACALELIKNDLEQV